MKYRIFVASPGDVSEERDIVSLVVNGLQNTLGQELGVELETVRWETHAWPDIGEDAQDVINSQIGSYDVFVGVMWRRFGTPTNRANSGTSEEFDRAYDYFARYGRPKVMFYFRRTPFYASGMEEWKQFREVLRFRKKLDKLGVYFAEYDDPIGFERAVGRHLTKQLLEAVRPAKETPARRAPKVLLSSVREDRLRVRPVYHALKARHVDVWMDKEDLIPGQQWRATIQTAIDESDVFVSFLSEASERTEQE